MDAAAAVARVLDISLLRVFVPALHSTSPRLRKLVQERLVAEIDERIAAALHGLVVEEQRGELGDSGVIVVTEERELEEERLAGVAEAGVACGELID